MSVAPRSRVNHPRRRLLPRLCTLLTLGALQSCSAGALLSGLTIGGVRTREGLAYGSHDRHRLDLYWPQGDAGGVPTAMLVFFYGGSWNSGARADYGFVGKALAARGLAVAIPDYRLYPEVRYPDFLEDCALATEWLRELARGRVGDRVGTLGGDSDRLFLMGHSAGAYNAAMLALDDRRLSFRPAGWIGLAGPYDFLPSGNPDVQPVFHHPDYPPCSQPIAFANAQAPRTFLGAAPQDQLVDPDRNTRQLAAKLRRGGVATTLRFYPGTSHMTLIGAFATPLRWLAPVLDDVVRFVGGVDRPDQP